MKNLYPSKTEILKKKPKFRKGVLVITKLWKTLSIKQKPWKNTENWIKIEKIRLLIEALTILHRKKLPRIILNTIYMYDQKNQTIHLDRDNPSIISALHETAHHIFGQNEQKATKWSIWIFKICFPIEYSKLKWDKHRLIK